MAKTVKALRRGFYGNELREEGDVFEIEDGDPVGSWMEELEPKKRRKPRKPKADEVEKPEGNSDSEELI